MKLRLTFIILGASMCFSWTSCEKAKQETQAALRPVRYEQVYSTGGSRVRTFSGTAKSGVEANLSFKVGGTIKEVPVKVGDRVRAGDLIARLDPEDYQLKVQQAEAALAQANAQQQKARADYDRVRGLYENNNASKSDLDAARAAYESANASVESSEKQLELARLQLSYTRLTARAGGSIASTDIEVNENVSPGRAVVMMTVGSDINVEVSIPEVLISRIHEDSPVTVRFDALEGKTYAGIVREVGVASTSFATTFPVTVRLLQPSPEILSGMAAEVAFTFRTSDTQERIVVPPFAVGEDRQGRFVYVVEPVAGDTAIVKKVNVVIGELESAGLEILNGLQDGDLVVTAGISKIQDGQKVLL